MKKIILLLVLVLFLSSGCASQTGLTDTQKSVQNLNNGGLICEHDDAVYLVKSTKDKTVLYQKDEDGFSPYMNLDSAYYAGSARMVSDGKTLYVYLSNRTSLTGDGEILALDLEKKTYQSVYKGFVSYMLCEDGKLYFESAKREKNQDLYTVSLYRSEEDSSDFELLTQFSSTQPSNFFLEEGYLYYISQSSNAKRDLYALKLSEDAADPNDFSALNDFDFTELSPVGDGYYFINTGNSNYTDYPSGIYKLKKGSNKVDQIYTSDTFSVASYNLTDSALYAVVSNQNLFRLVRMDYSGGNVFQYPGQIGGLDETAKDSRVQQAALYQADGSVYLIGEELIFESKMYLKLNQIDSVQTESLNPVEVS